MAKLCKEICQKCRKSTKWFKWSDADDEMWCKSKIVWCSWRSDSNCSIVPIAMLPDECVYKLEHIVVGNDNG